jgi:hypothetical protein
MVLRSHQNQPRSCFGTLQRGSATSLQNADDGGVGCDDANSNRSDHRNTEYQRHEERNHGQPPCLKSQNKKFGPNSTKQASTKLRDQKWQQFRCRQRNFRLCGFFNLPALPSAASDHPDAQQPCVAGRCAVVKYGVELCIPSVEQISRPVDVTEGQSSLGSKG